jgi:hypothetical protein
MRILHDKWNLNFPELLGTHMHWSKNELTSYIPATLESDDGSSILIQAIGIEKMILGAK